MEMKETPMLMDLERQMAPGLTRHRMTCKCPTHASVVLRSDTDNDMQAARGNVHPKQRNNEAPWASHVTQLLRALRCRTVQPLPVCHPNPNHHTV